MSDNTYTPGEISRMLAIPGSSLRRYVSKFGTFLSSNARKRRGRTFTENDMAIIAQIRDMAGQGVPLDSIAPRLNEVYDQMGYDQTGELPPQTALAVVNRIADQVNGLDNRMSTMEKHLDQLAREIREEQSKSFWDKLFGR